MDLVYAGAELTIIAAAGKSARYGLPGVSSWPRRSFFHAGYRSLTFQGSPCPTWVSLRSSPWASRGWTLQEGILSKRKLIFTNDQVVFQCNGMNCWEAADWPYTTTYNSEATPDFTTELAPLKVNMSWQSKENQYFQMCTLLENYTARSLTYQSDMLNAVLGILNAFARERDLEKQIFSIWCVPLIEFSNEWLLLLGWYHEKPAMRNPGFPSWSWMVWKGRMEYNFLDNDDSFNYETCQAWVLLEGQQTSVKDAREQRQYINTSPQLKVKARMTQVRVRHLGLDVVQWPEQSRALSKDEDLPRFEPGYYTVLSCTTNSIDHTPIFLDSIHSLLDEAKEHSAFLAQWSSDCLAMIVVEQKQDGVYERIGAFVVPLRSDGSRKNSMNPLAYIQRSEGFQGWESELYRPQSS